MERSEQPGDFIRCPYAERPVQDLKVMFMLCAGLLWFRTIAAAQEPIPVEPGARVRLTLTSSRDRVSGSYVGRTGDSVQILPQGAAIGTSAKPIAIESISRVELSRGDLTPSGRPSSSVL